MAQGYLQVDVVSDTNNFPITDASISISKTETPEEILEEVRTDSSGQTENVALEAPPAELSLAWLRPGRGLTQNIRSASQRRDTNLW